MAARVCACVHAFSDVVPLAHEPGEVGDVAAALLGVNVVHNRLSVRAGW